ncbi:deoxyribose-phosphate aldolase [Leucobacter chironomi]|uniref:deoxyribose-phosphate aldolase n=1 Tax=Leucobacter chironomi TaxID=491918 RepID=UPI000405863E|nr:deoxyribose-phosphate aldolase [Leucobacter chironomi]
MSDQTGLTAGEFLDHADHTLLASDTTAEQLAGFIAGAEALGVKRVCVLPSLLPVEKRGREIVTVVGFPTGAHASEVKAAETRRAVADGADEIDVVVNLGLVRSGDWRAVEADLRAVREACPGLVLKVILETAALSDDEIVAGCRAAEAAGADMVKTSTGFHPAGGASLHAVRLMAQTVGGRLGVKASGGIRSAAVARELWAAGATRFGVSATASILASWDDDERPEAADASY